MAIGITRVRMGLKRVTRKVMADVAVYGGGITRIDHESNEPDAFAGTVVFRDKKRLYSEEYRVAIPRDAVIEMAKRLAITPQELLK